MLHSNVHVYAVHSYHPGDVPVSHKTRTKGKQRLPPPAPPTPGAAAATPHQPNSPLMLVESFLEALTNADKDGRIVIYRKGTVPLTTRLASDSKAARVCARVTSACMQYTRTPLPPRKKVEGLVTRLACPLLVNLVHAFERKRVCVRVLALACMYSREYTRVRASTRTRVRLARDTRELSSCS